MCSASLGYSAPGPCSVQERASGHCFSDVSRASPTAVLGTPTHTDPELLPGVLQGPDKVADVMTKGRLYSARVDTPVDEGMSPVVCVVPCLDLCSFPAVAHAAHVTVVLCYRSCAS